MVKILGHLAGFTALVSTPAATAFATVSIPYLFPLPAFFHSAWGESRRAAPSERVKQQQSVTSWFRLQHRVTRTRIKWLQVCQEVSLALRLRPDQSARAAVVLFIVSPGTSGQTPAGKRAPMLSKWPNPNKLSEVSAWARGLWIRRVLVRAQEGQLGRPNATSVASGLRAFLPCQAVCPRLIDFRHCSRPKSFLAADTGLRLERRSGILSTALVLQRTLAPPLTCRCAYQTEDWRTAS